MTDDVFEDLVNLYLDKEISPAQLSILKDELIRSTERKRTFESYCRMHQASHFAALSMCPVVPRLGELPSTKNKPALFAMNRQVWAAAVLIAVIGSFATIYLNGPFGSARMVQAKASKLQKIETFAEATTPAKTSEPPLEFFRALKTQQDQAHEWAYVQELRHARAAEFQNRSQPSLYTWNATTVVEPEVAEDDSGYDLEYSSYEFRR
jgi:hypothetical protein